METILCAAIWYKDQPTAKILPPNIDRGIGHRHPHCIHTFVALTGKRSVLPECGAYEQGFITSLGSFVGRELAAKIAVKAGQVKPTITYLYSEDLY